MRIGTKLLMGFIPLAILTAMVAEVLYINSKWISESSQLVKEVYQTYRNITEMRKLEKNYQFYREKIYLSHIQDLSGRVTEFIATRQTLGEDTGIAPQFKNLEETLKEYQKVIELLGKSPGGDQTEKNVSTMIHLGQQLERLSEQMIQVAWTPIQMGTQKARTYSLVFAIQAALIGAVLAFYLSQLLVKPIRQLVRGTKKVAEGDFSQRVELRSRDEIGELARSFNRMVDSLEKGQARLNQQSEELRKTKEALENIFQSSVDAIVATDHKGYITFANRSMGEIASGKPGEVENLIGVRMSDLYSGGLPEARKIMNILREKGRLVNYETTMVRNGRIFPILTSASLLKDEKGVVVGTLGVIKDLSEKKKLEENLKEAQSELIQKEKLAAVGRLAAGVAHEINDPLTSILTFSNLLREESSSEDSKESLDIVIKEANRAKRIVYDLLSFSREAKPALEWIDLNDVLNVSLLLLEKQGALEGIEVHLDLARELPLVRADSGQMHPVFTNMILNAIQAMNVPNVRSKAIPARERRLSLRTHFYAAPEESLVPPSSLSGPFIRIVIGDTGCGICPENMTRIFDPFFTTKATGKGTGLGLYIVSNILKYYGAQSRLESTEGQGTTFTIDFPLSGSEKL